MNNALPMGAAVFTTIQQPKIRVLIVDDHITVLWGLGKLIESASPKMELVKAVTSGKDALAVLATQPPDVVLLDLDLGPDNGLQLLSLMREQAAVIILTGSRQISSEDLVLRGARGVIHKSEPAEVILKAIERVHQGDTWIDRSAMSRALKAAAARNSSPSERLTRAERRVISAVVQQCNAPNKVIAASLGLSEHTLRNHLAKIYSKLDIRRRIDLVLHARQHFLDLSDARPAGQWH